MLEHNTTPRKSYTIVLEITPTAPLTHGMGNEGNEQVLLTRQAATLGPDGWGQVDLPAVSGAAMKATLREYAVIDALEQIGVTGGVSKDAMRLLLKGGKNDSGAQTVSLTEARRMRDLFPLLSVFGSMDGGLPIKGKISVQDVQLFSKELNDAGLLPREVTPLHVTIDGQGDPGAAIEIYPGMPPIPSHVARSSVTYYRHDMLGSRMAPMIATADTAAVEDKRAANAAAKAPKKVDRREANESMPHSMQCIVAGAPMVCVLRLEDVTDVEFAVVVVALARWRASGGHLGGGKTKGHGACRVRVAGAIASDPVLGGVPAAAGAVVSTDPAGAVYDRYRAHIQERAAEIRAVLGESTR